MKILILIVDNATQAKLTLKPGMATLKIPSYLSEDEQYEMRTKMMKIVDGNRNTNEYLKLYYKVGTPYLFLNKKLSAKKKETYVVYKWDDL